MDVPYATQIDWADPFSYCRPSFLGFEDELVVVREPEKETDSENDEDEDMMDILENDRPIRYNSMDQHFGYAECRSASGKSKHNEDMAAYTFGQVHGKRYEAWILWDGHASWRCARLAMCLYDDVLRSELLRHFDEGKGDVGEKICDALSQSFTALDEKIRHISETCEKSIKGGAAMIVVFRCGRNVWVANAGDCKAVVAKEEEEGDVIHNETTHALNVCDTHTVTNERRRLQRLAYENPKLLGGVFCRRIFEPPSGMKKFRGRWTPRDTDIGTSVSNTFPFFGFHVHTYHQKSTLTIKHPHLPSKINDHQPTTNSSTKVQRWDFDSDLSVESVITRSDVMSEKSHNGCLFKSPMICGKHLFGVIQCSRGIGDFNLRAHENIPLNRFFHRGLV